MSCFVVFARDRQSYDCDWWVIGAFYSPNAGGSVWITRDNFHCYYISHRGQAVLALPPILCHTSYWCWVIEVTTPGQDPRQHEGAMLG
jgi:hypothetical protein